MTLQAPFPWFGGKSKVATTVWQRFGTVKNYVEPFFGSGAMLLGAPKPAGIETVNDLDGFIANFWRALKSDPDAVAHHCDWPVNEADLAARHYWLITEGAAILSRTLGDPGGYDPKIAGWWVWGICAWIGGGWCDGLGPWQWTGGEWAKGEGQGVGRRVPHIGNAGQGINRKLPYLGGGNGGAGRGINRKGKSVAEWLRSLSDRLRRVRVAHGDWSRVTGDSVTWRHGMTAVFLDPPYADSGEGRSAVYSQESFTVAHDVRRWAIEAGKRPDMRICLAGYGGEHDMPEDWEAIAWKAKGGYGSQGKGRGRANASRETLWFSPACLAPDQPGLF